MLLLYHTNGPAFDSEHTRAHKRTGFVFVFVVDVVDGFVFFCSPRSAFLVSGVPVPWLAQGHVSECRLIELFSLNEQKSGLMGCVVCAQVLPQILPEMQPKLSEERRQSARHAPLPGESLATKTNRFSGLKLIQNWTKPVSTEFNRVEPCQTGLEPSWNQA